MPWSSKRSTATRAMLRPARTAPIIRSTKRPIITPAPSAPRPPKPAEGSVVDATSTITDTMVTETNGIAAMPAIAVPVLHLGASGWATAHNHTDQAALSRAIPDLGPEVSVASLHHKHQGDRWPRRTMVPTFGCYVVTPKTTMRGALTAGSETEPKGLSIVSHQPGTLF
jgi:hypothetical protein